MARRRYRDARVPERGSVIGSRTQSRLMPLPRMKHTAFIRRAARRWGMIALVIWQAGCSPSARTPTAGAPTQRGARVLSRSAAAELAAKLANDECERLYKKRPFAAGQHAAVLEGGVYHWGRLDPGGPSGLSAMVSFRADGSQPSVEVYLSTDIF